MTNTDHPRRRGRAKLLADEVEAFLTENDVYTQREYHSETDISMLAMLD